MSTFTDTFVSNFLSMWCAIRYEKAKQLGRLNEMERAPVEEAFRLAEFYEIRTTMPDSGGSTVSGKLKDKILSELKESGTNGVRLSVLAPGVNGSRKACVNEMVKERLIIARRVVGNKGPPKTTYYLPEFAPTDHLQPPDKTEVSPRCPVVDRILKQVGDSGYDGVSLSVLTHGNDSRRTYLNQMLASGLLVTSESTSGGRPAETYYLPEFAPQLERIPQDEHATH